MKRLLQIFSLVLLSVPALAARGATVYQQPNNQANFVKLEKFKPKGPEVQLNHPHTFTDEQIRAILRSLKYSKKLILLKESKNRDIFELEYIDKFAPYLIEAFAKATPEQAVIWSVVQKRPYFIIRNDKLTSVRLWIVGDELHMDFLKVEAKLQGDYQAKTTGQRLIDEAKGVGVRIEPQQGQKFALDTTDTLIIDLKANWPQIADALDDEDERLREEAELAKKGKKVAKSPEASSAAGATTLSTTSSTTAAPAPARPAPSAKDQSDAQARLTELKALKDKGLITEKDYDKKKEEILKDL
ncbi:MAG: SHOCT domain-containing protein [Deltaproteobacteria bacterium]|nr:SHOCT domain-containing protein [Deltaproteobacteria bacterium]